MTVDGGDAATAGAGCLLIATENPIEQDGTYALPEAQLDRFLIRTSLGYPSVDEEIRILDDQIHGASTRTVCAGPGGRGSTTFTRSAKPSSTSTSTRW